MELYQIIHYTIIGCLLFEFSSDYKLKNVVIIIWCTFFTLFGGLRWNTGTDWFQYLEHFNNCSWETIFSYKRANGHNMEPGFLFINNLVKSLFGQFYIYNLLVVGLIQYTYYKFCHYFSPQRPLLMYIIIMTLLPNYFPIRAGLSLGISMWIWKFIKEKNIVMFFLIALCATSIHYQCFVLFPIYFFSKLPIKYKTASFVFFILAFVGVKFQEYFIKITQVLGGDLGDKIYGYTQIQSESYESNAGSIGFLTISLNFIFLSIYYYVKSKYGLQKNGYDEDFFKVLICSFIINIGLYFIFKSGMGDFTRLSTLFLSSQLILMTTTINTLCFYRNIIINKLIICLFILYLIYKAPANWSGYWFEYCCVPYHNIFDFNML